MFDLNRKELVQTICSNGSVVESISHSLAGIDVCTSLAALAIERNYTRPVVNNSLDFKIVGGFNFKFDLRNK